MTNFFVLQASEPYLFSYFFDKIIVCTDAVTLKIFQSLKSFKVRRLKNLLLIFYRPFIIQYRPF